MKFFGLNFILTIFFFRNGYTKAESDVLCSQWNFRPSEKYVPNMPVMDDHWDTHNRKSEFSRRPETRKKSVNHQSKTMRLWKWRNARNYLDKFELRIIINNLESLKTVVNKVNRILIFWLEKWLINSSFRIRNCKPKKTTIIYLEHSSSRLEDNNH